MRALICEQFTGIDDLVVGDLPDPEPEPGRVLVEVKAAAADFADGLLVSGLYQARPPVPFAVGSEIAGVVVDTGGHEGLSPGDRVCGFPGHGGMAEYVSMPAHSVIPLPDSLTFEQGAAIPVAYGTSYHALVDRGRLAAGETLLVLGASGGVGMAAVQIGHLLGARVIAAVSSEEKADLARGNGADVVIRYDTTPLREGIDEATGGEGVDVVYDPVGGESTELALRSTKWNGRLLVVGFAAGEIPSIPLNLTLVKGNSIVGVFWGRHLEEEPEVAVRSFDQIMRWAASGELVPHVQRVFPLAEGAEAIRWVADRKAVGRVVVTP